MSVVSSPGGAPDSDDVPRLLEAMRAVGSGLELRSTLERICGTAAGLADARYAAIGVAAEDGNGLAEFVYQGVDGETARLIGRLPDGHKGLLGALLRDPEPVRLAEPTADPRSCGFPEHHPPMRGFLGVPIRVQGEIFGNLYLAEKHGGGPFDDHDLRHGARAGRGGGHRHRQRASVRGRQAARALDRRLRGRHDRAAVRRGRRRGPRRWSPNRPAGSPTRPPESYCCPRPRAVWRSSPWRRSGRRRRWALVVPAENEVVGELLAGEAVFVEDAATDPRMLSDLARGYGPTCCCPSRAAAGSWEPSSCRAREGARPFSETERNLADAVRLAGRAGADDGRGAARPGAARGLRGPRPDRP